ncbi:MAG TPA: DUF3606 domain-containing protein [Ideonella sp.]|uniref:DUF3606 domain-containing protein n=1 Tax=Ideonella sp. TaxID=1929293 RepID=UPI002BFC6647|nr:DUF3606 domain-containing protein [Ideonella sp.]HSI51849.1 DUF3606 domain-containing protein [Ideonella sp.]
MPDDKLKTGRQDRLRINSLEDHEVRAWAKKPGVGTEALKAAAKAVGSMAADVGAYLTSHA